DNSKFRRLNNNTGLRNFDKNCLNFLEEKSFNKIKKSKREKNVLKTNINMNINKPVIIIGPVIGNNSFKKKLNKHKVNADYFINIEKYDCGIIKYIGQALLYMIDKRNITYENYCKLNEEEGITNNDNNN